MPCDQTETIRISLGIEVVLSPSPLPRQQKNRDRPCHDPLDSAFCCFWSDQKTGLAHS